MNTTKIISLSGAVLLALTSTCLAAGHGQLEYVYTTVYAGPPESPGTTWFGINNSGELVGNRSFPAITVATILDEGILTTWSATLPDGSPSPWNEFTGVNDNGVIVGDYFDESFTLAYDFIRSRHGDITLLPPVEPGAFFVDENLGINNEGTVVGTFTLDPNWFSDWPAFVPQGFILKHGKYTTWAYPGASAVGTFFAAINDKGTIAGAWWDAAKNFHAFLLNKDGSTTSIEPPASLSPAVPADSFAVALNDNDEVLVWYNYQDDATGATISSSFLLSHGIYTQIQLPNPQYPIDTLTYANSINDEGEIAGAYGPNESEGFVATPVH
ncbi:MAG: hypothetical protein ABSH34_16290 [Verrucomicrobiota bacterium]|jgi:hypothetical protein